MNIRFIKEYRALLDDGCCRTYQAGQTWSVNITLAQWLIDNGFAEEVKESGWWKPRLGERYYYFGSNGEVYNNQWENDSLDNARLKLGSVFKTEEATERYRDYMEAVETVRHDEGFMKGTASDGVYSIFGKEAPMVDDCPVRVYANTLHFDTRDHAIASLQNHTDEWRTILNYDWSKE